jgi:hypothetical protein
VWNSAQGIVRGLAALLLVLALTTACDSSPSEPLGGMSALLEGTLVAVLDEGEEEGEEDDVIVVEPIEHRQLLAEEGLVRIELVLLQGTDAETGETGDLDPSLLLPVDFGRVQPDGSCEGGADAFLVRTVPQAFFLSAVEYCFTVFAPRTPGGTGVVSDGDTVTYQIALVATE